MKKIFWVTALILFVFGGACFSGCTISFGNGNLGEMLEMSGRDIVLTLADAERILDDYSEIENLSDVELMSNENSLENNESSENDKYSKDDIKNLIYQIRMNMYGSTALSSKVISYEEGVEVDRGEVQFTKTEGYLYSPGNEEVKEWYKKENNTMYYYKQSNGQNTKTTATQFNSGDNIKEFLYGKSLITVDNFADYIGDYKIEGGRLYISLEVPNDDLNTKERFFVENGKIVEDRMIWTGVDMKITYKYNADADLSKIELPADVNWNNT